MALHRIMPIFGPTRVAPRSPLRLRISPSFGGLPAVSISPARRVCRHVVTELVTHALCAAGSPRVPRHRLPEAGWSQLGGVTDQARWLLPLTKQTEADSGS